MKRLRFLACLIAGPALAQEPPRDWPSVAAELQAQVNVMSARSAFCASDLALARKDAAEAKKAAEAKPAN